MAWQERLLANATAIIEARTERAAGWRTEAAGAIVEPLAPPAPLGDYAGVPGTTQFTRGLPRDFDWTAAAQASRLTIEQAEVLWGYYVLERWTDPLILGMRPTTWLELAIDYEIATGTLLGEHTWNIRRRADELKRRTRALEQAATTHCVNTAYDGPLA